VKFLLNDKTNFITSELMSSELKICLNFTLSCTEMHKDILGSQDLSKLSNQMKNIRSKKNVFNNSIYLFN
jgi:hypothetical protein